MRHALLLSRWLLGLVVGSTSLGCAVGSADEDPLDARPDSGDPEFGTVDSDFDSGGEVPLDEVGPTEDTRETGPITDEGLEAEPDLDSGPPTDSGARDTGTPDIGADTGCVPRCSRCGDDDGCGTRCLTGSCASGACVSGVCVVATKSYAMPSKGPFTGGWPGPLVVTVASESLADILFSTDGTAPTTRKPGPVDINFSTSGTLRFLADNGVAEPAQSLAVRIDTSIRTTYGFLVDRVRFATSKSPLIVARPGEILAGTLHYQTWNASVCAACRQQLVYGLGTTSEGCVFDDGPGAYPGKTADSMAFSVKAPATPGGYPLNVSYTLELSCANGKAKNPLGSRPTGTVGWVIVK